MQRIPAPKEQARLLAASLAERGCALTHQQALNLVAQLHGYRGWSAMPPAVRTASPPTVVLAAPTSSAELLAAAREVVNTADATGCSDDLTVTSAAAIERLEHALAAAGSASPAASAVAEQQVGGFGLGDVLSVRPDLTEGQAKEVLDHCAREFDASVGLNWDVLEQRAAEVFAPLGVDAWLVADGKRTPVFVRLHSGAILAGRHTELAALPANERRRVLSRPAPDKAYLWFADSCVLELDGRVDISDDLDTLVGELRALGVPFKPLRP
jgi:hypothetical protein